MWVGGTTPSTSVQQLTLSKPISHLYDKLGFYFVYDTGGLIRHFYREFLVDDYLSFVPMTEVKISFTWGYGNADDYFDIVDASTSTISYISRYDSLKSVVGIKTI